MSGAWHGNLPFESLYTAGLAGQRFLESLKKDARVVGTRCKPCGQTYVPARRYCERCMEGLDEYVEVGPRGTVVTLTSLPPEGGGRRPSWIAAVKLDGATTVLLHRLLGRARIGSRVRIVFERRRRGSLLDIKGFRPV